MVDNVEGSVRAPRHGYGVNRRYGGYTYFCVTRNPFSRLVSLYARGVLYHTGKTKTRYKLLRRPGFKEFLRTIIEIHNRCTPGYRFFVPISVLMSRCHRNVDIVLRFEDLDNEVKKLTFWNGVGLLNRSDREDKKPANLPWREFYRDQETVNLVLEHSWQDFERFNYPMSLS